MEEELKALSSDKNAVRLLMLMDRLGKLRLGQFPHQDFDLTVAQMEMIRFVGTHPGCHLQDVADGLDLTSPTVSVGIRRLEEAGLVARQADPNDGRAACLYLTETSQQTLREMMLAGLKGVRRFLDQFSPQEEASFFDLLEKAVRGVEAQSEEELS